jgi:hypothetical protein
MKKTLLCLVVCLFVLACFIPASASSGPTLTISPSPTSMVPGQTQIFTAAFSDGSQIQSCTWLVTGSLNAIQSTSANTAVLAAGTLKATYIATASCQNTNNVNAMGIAVIAIR